MNSKKTHHEWILDDHNRFWHCEKCGFIDSFKRMFPPRSDDQFINQRTMFYEVIPFSCEDWVARYVHES